MSAASLPLGRLLLAIAVMAVWGTNFVVIKFALAEFPPLLLATLRFALVLVPLVFFLPKPQVPWRTLAAYGVLIGAGQFGLLFLAMRHDITPGLASLIVQTQIFFTIGLSMRLTKERVRGYQWAALILAVAGIGVILLHTDATATPLGIGLVLLAALSWSGGNMTARAADPANMLAFVVWSSLFSLPPLLALTLLVDGWPAIAHSLVHANLAGWAAVAWQAIGNTLFGYTAWGFLLARHPAATVTPLALLVPVFGMASSALLLGEALPLWKLAAMALVMGGLSLNLFWPRLRPLVGRARGTA